MGKKRRGKGRLRAVADTFSFGTMRVGVWGKQQPETLSLFFFKMEWIRSEILVFC